MFGRVARNFSILTATQVVGAAILFVFMAFVARKLGPPHFGNFILIGAYVRLIALTVNAGVGPIAFRELARYRDSANELELFDDIISLRLALGIAGYAVLMGGQFVLGEDREMLIFVAIAGLSLIIEPFNESYNAYYTAHERVGIPSVYGFASLILSAAAGTAVLLAGYGLMALIVSELITGFAVVVVWTVAFRAKIYRFTFRLRFAAWRRLIGLVIPFAPIHLCNQLNRVINVILLGRISGPVPSDASVGYYGPPQSIINGIVNLVMGVRRVLIPPITAKLANGYTVTHELDIAFKLVMVVFALPVLLGTSFMAPEITTLLFGETYAPSSMALLILGWAGALQLAALVPETFLFSHPSHRVQDYIAGAFVSVCVNAIVCLLLIEEYGFLGAALGAVAARVVYLIYVAHYCRARLGAQALQVRQFGDTTLLMLAAFGVWYMMFAVITNTWIACAVAVVLTLPLMAAYILYLRRSGIRLAASER